MMKCKICISDTHTCHTLLYKQFRITYINEKIEYLQIRVFVVLHLSNPSIDGKFFEATLLFGIFRSTNFIDICSDNLLLFFFSGETQYNAQDGRRLSDTWEQHFRCSSSFPWNACATTQQCQVTTNFLWWLAFEWLWLLV